MREKLTESDISLTKQKRGDANRLGFAVQLCYMRYPGILSGVHETLDAYLLKFIAQQLKLARAVFFNRLGESRDRSFEQQQYRASGLNLVTAAIVLWHTVYIERAVNVLRESGYEFDEYHLQYLSPLGWEHINLAGDYLWKSSFELGQGKFRPLQESESATLGLKLD